MFGNLIIRCKTGFHTGIISALEMELKALIETIHSAKEMKCISAKIFSDSTYAIWALQSGITCQGANSCVDHFNSAVSWLYKNPQWTIHHIFRGKKPNCRSPCAKS